MNETKEIDNHQIIKWLRIVMYTAIGRLVNTLAGMLPFIPTSVTVWISRGILLILIISMIQLAPANDRYKKAGILRAVMLALTIVTGFLKTGTILTLVGSILSIVAMYQEYHAHSELIAEKDQKLSGKWSSLFMWSILSGLLLGFTSTAAAMIIAFADMDITTATAIIAVILSIPDYIIEVLCIQYLKKMAALFPVEEVCCIEA